MSADKISAEEMVHSLTGFEELAIEQHMGIDPYRDAEVKPMKMLRALVFVLKTREGMNPKAAKQAVMEMPMLAVQDLFSDEEEVNPEDPTTDSGKGSEPAE